MRHLATIQKIDALSPIEGADAIEVATVKGWQCVVKKGDFSVGDPCVYIEIDSFLPDRPEFAFMKPRGMRVRTIKLKGQISQGLVMPVSILADVITAEHELYAALGVSAEGADVTEALGIIKYEPAIPACLAGKVRGNFPTFIRKTDEERIQNMPDVTSKYNGTTCQVREKLDGSSATFYLYGDHFGVCSRNFELDPSDDNAFWQVARELNIEIKMRLLGLNIAIQGELIGEGIQKNKYKLTGRTVKFFSVWNIDKNEYLTPEGTEEVIRFLGLDMVPVIQMVILNGQTVPEMVEMATRNSLINPAVKAEGVVVRSLRPMTETFISGKTVDRGILSFKVINPEFLLKHEE